MMVEGRERVLLIDTCGESAGVGVIEGERLVGSEALARGDASAQIVLGVGRLLAGVGWALGEVDAVGVVCGPGSFTGMRVGLAAAKGLCEAAAVLLVAVSRLEVLEDAAGLRDGFAVLDAGRGAMYVRDVESGREWLETGGAEGFAGKKIVAAEVRMAERMQGCNVKLRELCVGDALRVVLRQLRAGAVVDAAMVDANYVRSESELYRKPVGA